MKTRFTVSAMSEKRCSRRSTGARRSDDNAQHGRHVRKPGHAFATATPARCEARPPIDAPRLLRQQRLRVSHFCRDHYERSICRERRHISGRLPHWVRPLSILLQLRIGCNSGMDNPVSGLANPEELSPLILRT